jgi:hypothetical protein
MASLAASTPLVRVPDSGTGTAIHSTPGLCYFTRFIWTAFAVWTVDRLLVGFGLAPVKPPDAITGQ